MKTIELGSHLKGDFAIIEKAGVINAYFGNVSELENLGELEALQKNTKEKVVFISPFSLATTECSYDTNTVGEKILAMSVQNQISISKEEILEIINEQELSIGKVIPSISDDDFEKEVIKVKEKINSGEVNQMILSRKFETNIKSDLNTLLLMYSKILEIKGPYMNFIFNTLNQTFIGSSPEKHLSIEDKNISMNPIAGTLQKGEFETFGDRLIEFLSDNKEIEELAMVIDEELKMISNMSDSGYIEYPLLKESGAVIHTEANLNGKIKENTSILDAFKSSMYAPTLVGGPIESAFKQIKAFENDSRGYYGGAFGIYEKDFLDTCIVIRTAFIDKLNNILSVRAGAGVVRESNPVKEVKETIFKANGFLGIFSKDNLSKQYLQSLGDRDKNVIQEKFKLRKQDFSDFYFNSNIDKNFEVEHIKTKRFLLLNFGDNFVNLSAFMINKMGGKTELVDHKDFSKDMIGAYDYVMIGPGYGDINNKDDKRISSLLDITKYLLSTDKKILGICLGHQAICKLNGYEIKRQEEITQGTQKEVILNGSTKTLGFYNSYSPVFKGLNINNIDLFENNRVLSYNTDNISSIQAHPESIMSVDGFDVLRNMILRII